MSQTSKEFRAGWSDCLAVVRLQLELFIKQQRSAAGGSLDALDVLAQLQQLDLPPPPQATR